MLAYYLLLGIPLFLEIVVSFYGSNTLSTEERIKNEKRIVAVFFFLYFLMLALRGMEIGTDTHAYKQFFDSISQIKWSAVWEHDLEHGFVILNKAISSIGGDFQFFLGVVALIAVLPIAYLYYKESESSILTITIFINLSVFTMLFSGLRQSIAISIGAIVFYCVKNKKFLWFLFFVFIAYNFHNSAFILLTLYPVYHIKITKKSFQFIVPLMVLLFIFKKQVFSFLIMLMNEDYQDKYSDFKETGAYMILILFVLFTVYSFIEMEDKYVDKETMGLRNILVVATCIQMFSSVHYLAMRMNYYFILFVPIVISKISVRGNKDDKVIVKVINVVLCAFFLFYFFYSAETGADILNIFPYETFWSR